MNVCCFFLVRRLGLFALHLSHEALGGLEAGEVVCLNHNCGVLRDVAGSLFSAVLHHEAAESTQIYILFLEKTVFNALHESLNGGCYVFFRNAGCIGYLIDNVRFSHCSNVNVYRVLINFGVQRYEFLP